MVKGVGIWGKRKDVEGHKGDEGDACVFSTVGWGTVRGTWR